MGEAHFSVKCDMPVLYSSVRPILSTSEADKGAVGGPLHASYSLSRISNIELKKNDKKFENSAMVCMKYLT